MDPGLIQHYRARVGAFIALSVLVWGCGVQLRQSSTPATADLHGTGTIGLNPTSGDVQYVYAIESATGTIQPLIVDPFSASLTISGLVTAQAISAVHFRARSDGKFVYLAESGANAFSGFQIGLDGNLTLISGAPWGLGSGGEASEIGSEGRDLYVAEASPGVISSYTIGSTGVPTAGPSYVVGADIAWLRLSANGKFLYAGAPGTGEIYGYTRNTATGALSVMVGSPFAAPASTSEIVIDPNNVFLVASGSGAGLQSYLINSVSGALTPVTTIASATGFDGIVLEGSGAYLYAINVPAGEIHGFSVDATTGALAALGGIFPISVPNVNPRAIAVDQTGELLFLGDSTGSILGYSIIQATGELAQLTGYPLVTGLGSVDILGTALPNY